jgi:hypothetical protein
MSNELEKDMDDEVYEDSFYENEEELNEDEVSEEDGAKTKAGASVGTVVDTEIEDDTETRIPLSFACEDCDYRWDDVIIQSDDDDDDVTATCPMCGSENVSQI